MKKRACTIRKYGIIFAAAVCFLTGCANYGADGTKAMEEGNYKQAAVSFEQAAKQAEAKGKDATEAYRGLGMAYYEQKDYGKAQESFQKVIDLGGEKTPTLYNLMGICAMQLEDYAGALSALEQGLSTAESAETLAASKSEEAVDYSKVIQEMKFNRIVCYEKQQDWENAKSAVSEYVNQYPDDKDAEKEMEFLETR